MEPTKTTRLILPLGKFRVVQRTNNSMRIDLGKGIGMVVELPDYADVHEGDILTLYTEVLYAKPSRPSIE